MIDLNSPEWQKLTHAYGVAVDTPVKLAALYGSLKNEKDFTVAWEAADFWSSIFHQDSVYSATFAAIPHLVEITKTLPMGSRRSEITVLISSCVASSSLPGTIIPPNLIEQYQSAVQSAIPLCSESILHEADGATLRYLLASMAALKGFAALSFVIGALDCSISCPKCDTFIEPMESELNLLFMKQRTKADRLSK